MLNFALSSIPKGGEKCSFDLSSFKSPVLVRDDTLTSEESKARMNYEYFKQLGMVTHSFVRV